MRTLKLFGWLCHFLTVTLFLFGIIFFLATKSTLQFDDFSQWTITINNIEQYENKELLIKSFFIGIWLMYIIYFVAIFTFNLSVRDFEKKKFIHSNHIKRFQWIGILFIFNYFVSALIKQFITIRKPDDPIEVAFIFSEKISTEFQTPLGGLLIGLFFLVLSQVFKEALKQKQENELTI